MIFTRLIENSLEAGILILAVFIITLLMWRKAKIYSYILWVLVFAWLLVPVHISTPVGILPEISLEKVFGIVASDAVQGEVPDGEEPQKGIGEGEEKEEDITDTLADGQKENIQQSEAEDEVKGDVQQSEAGDDGTGDIQQNGAENDGKGEVWQSGTGDGGEDGLGDSFFMAIAQWILPEGMVFRILFGIWVLGAVVMSCRGAWGAIRLQRSLQCAVRCEQFGIKNVYQSEGIEVPIVSGIFHPGIYLPKVSLEPYQQLYILEHEQMHIRRKDFLVKAIAYGVLCLHWFNPLVWFAFAQLERSMEFSCDEAVVERLGEGQKKEYSRTLLTMAAGGFSQKEKGVFALGFLEKNTKGRIRNILEYEYRGKWTTMATSAVLVGCFVCFLGEGDILLAGNESADMQELAVGTGNRNWKDDGKGQGMPVIVVNKDGNIIGTCRGKELKNVVLNFTNNIKNELSSQENKGAGYRIEDGAFYACENMEILIVENSQDISYVAENAFQGCPANLEVYCGSGTYLWKRLKKMGITCIEYSEGDSVEEILNWDEGRRNIEGKIYDNLPRDDETTLEDSYIASEVVTIEDPDEEEMRGNEGSPYFIMTEERRLIGMGGSLLEETTSLMEGVEFPSEAKSMDHIFSQADVMIKARIPVGMEEIGDGAFNESSLCMIEFEGQNGESQLKRIGANAFAKCVFSDSPRLVIPEGVTEIGARAFSDCEGLEEIVLPKSLKKIGEGCFAGCISLKKVTVKSLDAVFEKGRNSVAIDGIFYHCGVEYIEKKNKYTKSEMVLYAPKGSTAQKYAAERGIQFQKID